MSLLSRLFSRKPMSRSSGRVKVPPARVDIHRGVDVHANSDIISGYRFCATMQLRTPLRVLSRHGELHPGLDEEPPQIAQEMWEGIWLFELRSWRELGIDADAIQHSMASDIGPVSADGGDYLKFLIAVRTVAEGNGSIEKRRSEVARVLADPAWQTLVLAHKGGEAILDKLFPPFVTTIPLMPAKTAVALLDARYDSPASLARAKASDLLAIAGVGPAIVSAIRRECQVAPQPNSGFVDRVVR